MSKSVIRREIIKYSTCRLVLQAYALSLSSPAGVLQMARHKLRDLKALAAELGLKVSGGGGRGRGSSTTACPAGTGCMDI